METSVVDMPSLARGEEKRKRGEGKLKRKSILPLSILFCNPPVVKRRRGKKGGDRSLLLLLYFPL